LGPTIQAKKKGYTVNLFLDAKSSTFIEEFATSNFAALTAPDATGKRTYVTPKSSSILPSITNRSLTELAAKYFGWNVVRRRITWEEVKSGKFEEIAACGTAVVITPVGQIDREVPATETSEVEALTEIDTMWTFEEPKPELLIESFVCPSSDFDGFKQLYTVYRQIQNGEIEDKYGWLYPKNGI
jgi:branched-chain amino acid aminotransferase